MGTDRLSFQVASAFDLPFAPRWAICNSAEEICMRGAERGPSALSWPDMCPGGGAVKLLKETIGTRIAARWQHLARIPWGSKP
jgi:hypothetical protein